jgi:hypothetical protein
MQAVATLAFLDIQPAGTESNRQILQDKDQGTHTFIEMRTKSLT